MANGLLCSRIWALAGLICLVSQAFAEGFQPPQRAGVAARLRHAQDLGRDHAYGADFARKGSHKSALRLRGGGIFTKLDDAGASCFGKSLWGFLKAMMGLSSKPKNSPEEDLAELQAIKAGGKKAKEMRGGKVTDDKITDRKSLYFMSQGVVYALNPMTHIARKLRGTEDAVRTAVVFLQDPPAWAEGLSVEERISLLVKAKPDGLGMTPARAKEATYRAGVDGAGGGGGAGAAGGGPAKGGGGDEGVEFTGEEDEELKALTEKMAAKAGGKGGQISKVATQKYTGSQGGIVKRLQKELIRIQGTGSFEVELVNDSIFEWYVTIEGAKGSFYEGERFKLRFHFDHTYPMSPPEVTFVVKVPGWDVPEVGTKSASGKCPSQAKGQEWPAAWGMRKHHCPIHPHIYTNGHICLSIIYDDWSPALGVEAVCHSMVSMLSSAKEKMPPADNEMHVDSGATSARKVTGWDFHDNEA